MSASLSIVKPISSRFETLVITGVVLAVTAAALYAVSQRRVDDALPRLFDWHVSATKAVEV